MIFQDLIASALEGIGAYSPNEQQGGADFDLAFQYGKAMLEAWQIERLTIDHIVRSTFTLTANVSSFTIGITSPASTWVLARPETFMAVSLVDSNEETELDSLTDEQYAVIANKAETGVPTRYWYQRLSPAGKVFPFPIQTANTTVALYVPTPLAEIATIGTTIYLPSGWKRAIRTNLQVELCPAFGITVSPTLERQAQQAKAAIKAINAVSARISTEGYSQTYRS